MAKISWTNIDPAMKKNFDKASDAEKNYVKHEIGKLAEQINDSNLSEDALRILIGRLKKSESSGSGSASNTNDHPEWRRKLPAHVLEVLEKEERLSAESKKSIEDHLGKVFGLSSESPFDF
ncbi:hypothetical protein C7U61_02420 [Rhizobium sp. JAB6]|uniref:hypothetical protein n=1 Tax=Rhizobium sp. JAB6 TaxID=2127050 RepID=UPI000D1297DA|nr:hypothetical protein [Rhizobium sp. JAB6]PST23398.1 hypothetical protein C7U61_02420 [Rhizobium sp. JAB6]